MWKAGGEVFMRIRQRVGNVDIHIDTKRIDRNIREAQKLLNIAVRKDCEPLVPHLNGGLRGSANFPEGIYGGILEYNTSYAHYLYQGELYLASNGSSWAKKHEKKYPAGKSLTYHPKGAGTTDHWFDEAKRLHKDEWINAVKDEVGKG